MLRGIRSYAVQTREWYETGREDAGYCSMRTCTARAVAEKLRKWAMDVEPEYLESVIAGIDDLLKELASELEEFHAAQEQAQIKKGEGDGKKPPPGPLDALFGEDIP